MFINSTDFFNEEKLLDLIKKGDPKAFEQFFRFYYSDLCSYLRTLIRERDVIEEIVQGLFVYLWENRENFSPKGNIKSYLFKALRNRAFNHFRNASSRQDSAPEIKLIYSPEYDDIEKDYDAQETNQLISNSVALLPEKCREIFTLIKFNGLTYQETADILNLSVKTIETQMGRALKKLKESLLIHFN